jgi:hypothetical protein
VDAVEAAPEAEVETSAGAEVEVETSAGVEVGAVAEVRARENT